MLYSILIYDSEDAVASWTKQEDDALIARHTAVRETLAAQGRLGPVARLMPTTTAVTLRHGGEPIVVDGPYAETKEALLGLYIVECATLDEAIEAARLIPRGTCEIRPISLFYPGKDLQ